MLPENVLLLGREKQMNSISVILPCAGEGKRLGASGAKELFEIYPGKKLIDFSIAHIKAFISRGNITKENSDFKVITVIKPGKEDVFEHVKNSLKEVNVEYVMFNDNYREWPGSVYSARSHLLDMNIVFLPDSFIKFGTDDQIYSDEFGETLISKAVSVLRRAKVVLGVINCTDPDRLSSLGAVRVVNNKVELFKDKPQMDQHKYNGFWGVYGFRDTSGGLVYEFLIDSVEKKKEKEYLLKELNPEAFYIDTYHDLGTTESVKKFMNSR